MLWKEGRHGHKMCHESRHESIQPLGNHLVQVSNPEGHSTEQMSSSPASKAFTSATPFPWHPSLLPLCPAKSYHVPQPAQSHHSQASGQHRPLRTATKLPHSPPPSGPSHSGTSYPSSVAPQRLAYLYALPWNNKC